MKIDRHFLNLTGEYRVCAELLKRHLLATITYGTYKGVDVFTIGEKRKIAAIEVKASNSNRFVTGLYQKYPDPKGLCPHFWVLYSITWKTDDEGNEVSVDRFFILSHEELAVIQAKRNAPKEKLTYGQAADRFKKGVDNVLLEHVAEHENRWDKIIDFCKG